MAKVYAVRKGHQIGIFHSWPECNKAVNGYPMAEYKSFNTSEEAQAYLEKRDIYEERLKNDLQAGYGVAFVDGSFDKNSGKYGSGVIAIKPDGTQDELYRAGSNTRYSSSGNVAGEIFAALMAMDWAVTAQLTKLRIYHDYEGIHHWISGSWRANTNISQEYVNIFNRKYKDILNVEFFKVEGHSNNKYNEIADELAKSALKKKAKFVHGDGWVTVSNVKKEQLAAYLSAMEREVESLKVYPDIGISCKHVYSLECLNEKVTVTFYPEKKKLLIQGAVTPLFQIILRDALIKSARSSYRQRLSI